MLVISALITGIHAISVCLTGHIVLVALVSYRNARDEISQVYFCKDTIKVVPRDIADLRGFADHDKGVPRRSNSLVVRQLPTDSRRINRCRNLLLDLFVASHELPAFESVHHNHVTLLLRYYLIVLVTRFSAAFVTYVQRFKAVRRLQNIGTRLVVLIAVAGEIAILESLVKLFVPRTDSTRCVNSS